MSFLRSALLLVCLVGLVGVVGCGESEPDPTTLPDYKDMTDPANMPTMSPQPGGDQQ